MKNSWLNSIAFLTSLYCNYAIPAEFVYPAVDPNIPNGVLQQLLGQATKRFLMEGTPCNLVSYGCPAKQLSAD